ncbi:MAG: hypothetical protein RIQ92_817 [Actinomycetota bacterium]
MKGVEKSAPFAITVTSMNSARINNYRMAAYAALAVGLINLRYQTGAESNFMKSAALFIPGALLISLTFTSLGKKWLDTRSAALTLSIVGSALLIYSFVL